ncbi:MAG: chromosome segregation protein SMC [Chthoniobacterales bacterium]
MYLKSLEIVGFKSFAQKTILEFHRGVTAIVGPNGCGKSNVLDAMRWVLGEQSAKALRGGEMADVIFSGTDSRTALGMAEVSLTFAECEKELGVEWNEVRITRRIFRDGKSEYLLNKTPCRLRDIHQMFMDTGIGRSAYSIMEQGKIDLILSSRPEDRRAIFEEAAGITKYKSQKKEALRKLEYTEANLLRVSDIIKEVKRQIGSLQRQAAKARRYQTMVQDLRIFDTHLSHRNYQKLDGEKQALTEEIKRIDEAHVLHQSQIEMQELELAESRQKLGTLDEQINGVRDNAQTCRNRIFSAESRIQTNGERAEESSGMMNRFREEMSASEIKIQEQESQIHQTDQLIQEILSTLGAGEESLQAQNGRVQMAREERASAEQQMQEAATRISAIEGSFFQLDQEIARISARREAAETRLAVLQGELSTANGYAEQLRIRLGEISSRLESARFAQINAQTEGDQAQYFYEECQQARQSADVEANAASRTLAEQESRLEVLRQLQEEGEGFGEGTQAVLRGLDNPEFFKSALHGVLADLVDVEPQYIPAVEAALGANLQTIIFKDTDVTESALRTLSANKLGKASIAPRNWLHQSSDWQKPFLPEGALTWAIDCVKAEESVSSWINRLLQNVLIAPTLESAFALKSSNPSYGIATLTGEFISVEGIVYGGKTGDVSTSALMRRAQIATLDRDLVEGRAHAEELVQRRNAATEALDASQTRLRESREQLQNAQVNVSTLTNELSLLERQVADAESRTASFESELLQVRTALAESDEKNREIGLRREETSTSLSEARSRHLAVQARIEELRERERTASEELSELRLKVATDRQRQENLARQREPLAARMIELGEIIVHRQHDIESYEQKIETLRAENIELEGGIGTWREEMEVLEQEIATISSGRAELQAGAEALDTSLRNSRRQITEFQEQHNRLELRNSQIDMRLEALFENVQRRYQLHLPDFTPDSYALLCALRDQKIKEEEPSQDATLLLEVESTSQPAAEPLAETAAEVEVPQENEQIPWPRIESMVAALTAKLDSMGPVNLDAIQEYDELEERYQFLEQQNTDLINSKAELMEVITRINKTTRELFAETFEKVRINFQEMFTELFGGGKANLMLQDESDPLESGIEIIAKPPGKQLQSVSLLSGGERTMTAVSLLFAIYMVKPSPFCVLDEMDAPLDESNINRFVKILDRFVDQSQFVVITHSKRTISRADMLYGVTMEEHGVSKLVSVRFNKNDSDKARASNGHEPSVAESFGKSGNLRSEQDQLISSETAGLN